MTKQRMKKGIIFDIKRYAIHDGPGIRTTVFFKGCPLHCPWCHNPEGQEEKPEIMWQASRCALECTACVSVCPQMAVEKKARIVLIDRQKCDLCGQCVEACLYEALEIVGREVTVEEVMAEVEKDRIFYEESGGGVTFSGGEPLFQPDFLEALLEACRQRNIQTAIDTCGYVSPEVMERIAQKVDLFLYDLKIIDDRKHREYTGVSNKLIFENLKMLLKKKKPVIIRIPLISGINDDQPNIKATVNFLYSLNSLKEVNLLPYHKGGDEKFRKLGKQNPRPEFRPSSETKIKKIKKMFESHGFSVKIGG